jgi:hypothetical protein
MPDATDRQVVVSATPTTLSVDQHVAPQPSDVYSLDPL